MPNSSTSSYQYSPEIFTQGTYFHTVGYHYTNFPASLPNLFTDNAWSIHIQKLKDHLAIAKNIEAEFYKTFGVDSAETFSTTFLYGNFNPNKEAKNLSQKLLKILNNQDAVKKLIASQLTPEQNKDIEKLYSQAAKKLIEEQIDTESLLSALDMDSSQVINKIAEGKALELLRTYLNSTIDNKTIKKGIGQIIFKVDSKRKGATENLSGQVRALRSNLSSHIRTVLQKTTPDLTKKIRELRQKQLSAQKEAKINNYLNYFEANAKSLFPNDDSIKKISEDLRENINTILNNSNKVDKEGNLILSESQVLTNFSSASGAMFEMILSYSLVPPKSSENSNSTKIESQKRQFQTQNKLLANDVVTDYKYTFQNGDFNVVQTQQGEKYRVNYKSPVDMVIEKLDDKNKVTQKFTLQFKNNIQNITDNLIPPLKLQNGIQLNTFLGNTRFISNASLNNLLIYHIVNQMVWQNTAGKSFIEQMLNSFIELYTESAYVNATSQELSSIFAQSGNRLGNMFFIYGGRLIPMSYFLEAIIQYLDKPYDSLINEGAIKYPSSLPTSDETERPNKQLDIGQQIYNSTSITKISIAMDKVLAMVDKTIKSSV